MAKLLIYFPSLINIPLSPNVLFEQYNFWEKKQN